MDFTKKSKKEIDGEASTLSSGKRKRDCDTGDNESSTWIAGVPAEAIARGPQQNEHSGIQDEDCLWGTDIHSSFVAAIFEEGLKHSSPSVIMENMVYTPKALTSERVKSHLQKFRKSKQKEKQKFMEEHAAFVLSFRKIGKKSRLAAEDTFTIKKLLGGKAAGYVTHSVMAEDKRQRVGRHGSRYVGGEEGGVGNRFNDIEQFVELDAYGFPAAKIAYPNLTDEEKKEPIGTSLSFVISIIEQMGQYVGKQRSNLAAVEAKRFHSALQEDSEKALQIDRDKLAIAGGGQEVPPASTSMSSFATAPPFLAAKFKSNTTEDDNGDGTGTTVSQTEPQLPSMLHDFQWRKFFQCSTANSYNDAPSRATPPQLQLPFGMKHEVCQAPAQSIRDPREPPHVATRAIPNQDLDYQDQQYLQLPGAVNDSSWLFGTSLVRAMSAESYAEALLPSNTRAASLLHAPGTATELDGFSERTNSNNGDEFPSYLERQEEQNNDALMRREDQV